MTDSTVREALLLELRDGVRELKPSLGGILVELQRSNLRQFDSRDFLTSEIRRVARAVERMADQLEKIT